MVHGEGKGKHTSSTREFLNIKVYGKVCSDLRKLGDNITERDERHKLC